jgi:hypothetical protein
MLWLGAELRSGFLGIPRGGDCGQPIIATNSEVKRWASPRRVPISSVRHAL